MTPEERLPSVLIVDDTQANLQLLGQMMRQNVACKLLVADSGPRALAAAQQELPDLILLDVLMPGMDGFEVCDRLKANDLTRPIPVIFLTALDKTEDMIKGLEKGAIDYIPKPFHARELILKVKTHLELKQYRDLFKELAFRDGLTGLPNRRKWDETLSLEWRRAIRNEQNLSLIMADIDFFKKYNDHHGHLKGDDCLKSVAEILKHSILRPADLVARYGGEEFSCILPDTDLDGAHAVAERIQEKLSRAKIPHQASPLSSWITMSMGACTTRPNPAMDMHEWVGKTDQLLYQAKEQGRNQICAALLK